MLERGGVDVEVFDRCNDEIDAVSTVARVGAAVNSIWSRSSRAELGRVLDRVRPDVVHVHNTFATLSPSIYGVCKQHGAAVVQTLHNFRLFCPAALFLRDGKPCEACVDKSLLESMRNRCYRGSLGATAVIASNLYVHRQLGTYSRHVDRYIALTQFGRGRAIRGGIPAHQIVVKPNFIPDPPHPGKGEGGHAVFVGRITEGKGVETLLEAWRKLPDLPLRILGDGHLRPALESKAQREGLNVQFFGSVSKNVVMDLVASARFIIVPSVWYETFGLVVAEAFACGTPALVSRIGSLDELVEDGVTGRKFSAGDPADLATLARELANDSSSLANMRGHARAYFDQHLTEERNFVLLKGIYADAIAQGSRKSPLERAAWSAAD